MSQTVQKGMVYLYNGGAPKTPLGNVTISCPAALNNNVLSQEDGSFSLIFNDLFVGDPIGPVEIKKREMMVFNQAAVDEWSIRNEPLLLIMCNKVEFERQKQRLIEIGRMEAEKRYNRRVEALEKEYSEGLLALQEKEDSLNRLWDEMTRLYENLDNYVEIFNRVDLSIADSVTRRAISCFKQGLVEDALLLFESQDNLNRLKQENQSLQKIQSVEKQLRQSKDITRENIQSTIRALHIEADAYVLLNEWGKAGLILKSIADELETEDAFEEYGTFLEERGLYDDAFEYYSKCVELYRSKINQGELIDSLKFAIAINDLARVSSFDIRSLKESENLFKEAIDIRNTLYSNNPGVYASYLVSSLTQYGKLLFKLERFSESKQLYLNAIELARTSCSNTHLLNALRGFASLLMDVGEYSESECVFLEALSIASRLDFPIDAIDCLINLSLIYSRLRNYLEAANCQERAYALTRKESFTQYAESNPVDYAGILNNLAVTYGRNNQFDREYELLQEAIRVQREMAFKSPYVHGVHLVSFLINMASNRFGVEKYEDSMSLENEAIAFLRKYQDLNPLLINPLLAVVLHNSALTQLKIGSINVATERLKEAIVIQQRLFEFNNELNEPNLAAFQKEIASHLASTQIEEAELYYEESIHHYSNLAKRNPNVYDLYLADTYYDYASALPSWKRNKAIALLRSAKQIVERHKDESSYSSFMISIIGDLSYELLFINQFEEAEKDARFVLKNAPQEHWVATNLAAALLLQGKYKEAETVYCQYKDEKNKEMLEDLKSLEEAGIITDKHKKEVDKIRKMLITNSSFVSE